MKSVKTKMRTAIMACEQKSARLLLLDPETDWNDERALLWEWSPARSEAISHRHHEWFSNLTDGKRVLGGTHVLVSASGGGVAMVRLADKAAVFHAYAGGNTHSVELLPDGNLVSASSTGGYLRIFCTAGAAAKGPEHVKYVDMPIKDAHGVVWQASAQRLWAVGGANLLRCRYSGNRRRPSLEVEATFTLPGAGGGHDLFPVPGSKRLFVTGEHVWTFDPKTETFAEVSRLRGIKSISQRGRGGPIIMMEATESWWSDSIRYKDGRERLTLDGARFYKARWWQPNTFSYADH